MVKSCFALVQRHDVIFDVKDNSPNCPNLGSKCFVCLFGLMLYVQGKQLRSCRDGKLSYPHCSWAGLPKAAYQYLAHIISPLTDKCSSSIS